LGKTFFSKVIVVLFATLVMITMVPPYQNAAATGQTFTINSVSQCTSTSDYTTDTSSGCTINNLNLQPGDTLNIGFQSVAVNLGTDGVNSGIINISSLSLLSTNGHALTNNGVINISGGVFVSSWDNFLHAGNLINNGLIQVTSGGQLQTDGGGLTDNGQITIDGSAHSGLFEDVPQGVQGAATDTITNGGSITSAGEIQVYAISVQPGGTLSTTNVVNAYGFLSNSGTFTTTSQIFTDTFNNNGHLTLTGSSLIDARFFNNNNGGVVDNSSPQFNIGSGNSNEASGTFVNNGGGTVNNHGAMNMFGGINNSGLLRNYGSFTVDSYGQPIYNPGTIIAECGSTPISDIINGIQQIFPNGITNGCVPPTLTISSPANNVNLNANTLTISGTASAAFPITTITWSVDNGQTTTASGTTSWSFSTGQLADGTHTIMVTATDNNGNTATKSVSVTIDTDLPSITVPSPITSQATGPHGAVVTYTATGSDNPDGPITPVCTPASGSTFALGSTTVNCSVTDKAGNIAHASFQVTVQDTISPTLKLPANITQEATGPSGAPVTFSATATDIVDGTDPVTCTPASGSTFALGSTTVNCSSTNHAGNTATASFQVTVQDTISPTLKLPANITQEATGPSGAPVTFSATATDIVDGTDPVTCTPASGSTFALGSTTVNCSSTDAHGNTASGSFHITVQDTTAPVLALPTPITATATSTAGAPVTFSATATDIVDGTDPVTCTPASGSTFALGTATVTCTTSDLHSNTSTGSFTVTVNPGPVSTVKISPPTATTIVGSTPIQFTATSQDQFGNIRTGDTLTWSVVSGGGSISSTGLYTPGTTAGTTVIAATDNSISGSATVTANNPNTVVQNQGGANLKGDNLQFLNLSNFNLSGDNLKGVTLQGSDLQGANLAGANLASANLQNVNLAGANLSGANLQGVDLSGANLQGANLKGANLQGTNLQNDNLLGANLQGNNLQGANLSGANLQNANLSGANLQSANLQNANISGANLTGANVHKANLQGTITSGITPSTLSGCLNNSVCQ
jgi:uncharacterized protein YjbI with pentapeptide repeats